MPNVTFNPERSYGQELDRYGEEAKAEVTGVSPAAAYQRLQDHPEALLGEVRVSESVPMEDRSSDVVMISLGSFPMRADLEIAERLRDSRLEDRSRQVILT